MNALSLVTPARMSCAVCGTIVDTDAPICESIACMRIGASPPVKRTYDDSTLPDLVFDTDDDDAVETTSDHSSPSHEDIDSSSSSSSSRTPTPPLFDERDFVLDHFINTDLPPMVTVHAIGRVGLPYLFRLLMLTVPATAAGLVGKEPAPLEELMAAGYLAEDDYDAMYAPDDERVTATEAMRQIRLFELLSAYLLEYGAADPGDRELVEHRLLPRIAGLTTAEAVILRRAARRTLV